MERVDLLIKNGTVQERSDQGRPDDGTELLKNLLQFRHDCSI